MAGRRTFFSFHYQRDIFRANVVRNAGMVDAQAAAGWTDSSVWEEAKRQGDEAIRRLIRQGLNGTSVTAVLLGTETHSRRWVNYEIEQSQERGNGLLGVHIHMIPDPRWGIDVRGPVPYLLNAANAVLRDWDRYHFGEWIEVAAVRAGHPCLRHGVRYCSVCA